jgi:hypothetical protein
LVAALLYGIHLYRPQHFQICLAAISIVYLYSVIPLVRMLITGTAVIVTDRGLLDRTGGVNFVAWDEINGVQVQSCAGLTKIALDLRDAEGVLGRMSLFGRILLRFYMKRYGGKPNLTASFVEGGAEPLVRLIQERIRSARGKKAV